MNNEEKFVKIAIDGPSASGKSTIAKILAKKLDFLYIDTGAMYRAFTYAVLQANLDPKDEEQAESLIGKITIAFNSENKITLDGKDVSKEIRKNDVANNVSYISSYKNIRLEMVRIQREISNGNNVVMDGRDIGTYVLPDADLKIFQVAHSNERAKRRYLENLEKGIETSIEDCLDNIKKRDYIDSNRAFCPLKPAEDSVEIDTTNLSINEVVDIILTLIEDRGLI